MSNHPIFTGPAVPCGTVFTGNFASHGIISGGTPTVIMTGTAGTTMAELNYGTGKAMFSCLNTANWLSPSPNAANFKSNILSYMSSGCGNVGLNKASEVINGLSVYPNPGKGLFTMELNNDLNKTIEIRDVTGKLIQTLSSSDKKIELDLKSQAKGIYFLKILSDNMMKTVKLIKE